MSKARRILCIALAVLLTLGATLMTGCSAPRLTLGGTSNSAGSVGDVTLSTGEYLAYLYNTFYNMYYGQGLYQYAAAGYDIWGQEFTYGEGDDAQKVAFADYVRLLAQDSIVRQVAVEQLMKKYNISWIEDDQKTLEENMKDFPTDAYLELGISDENFKNVYKKLNLNETSLFYTLYGEGGERAVSEADRKTYFDENYLSYKIISVALTNSEGAELSEAEQKKVLDQLEGYRADYNKNKNFEAVVDAYNKANKEDGAEVKASTDEDNRVNADANNLSDEELVKAIRGVDVGAAKVVTYKANGSTLTGALILRLDPNNPDTLFTDETRNILYGSKYEEFDKEVDKVVESLTVNLKKSVVKKCDPKNFVAN